MWAPFAHILLFSKQNYTILSNFNLNETTKQILFMIIKHDVISLLLTNSISINKRKEMAGFRLAGKKIKWGEMGNWDIIKVWLASKKARGDNLFLIFSEPTNHLFPTWFSSPLWHPNFFFCMKGSHNVWHLK